MPEYPETAEGTLVVMVCRAKHLPNRRKLDKQSPYVLLRLHTVAKKTPAHFRAGQTPEWTHEIRFQLTRERRPIIRLDVLDETKNDPTPIGGVDIDCSSVFSNPANLQDSGKYILDSWYDLDFKQKYAGKIYLEMTFYPSAPMLPPKVSYSKLPSKILPEAPLLTNEDDQFRHSAPEVLARHNGPDDDVFVTSAHDNKRHFFRSSQPEKPSALDDVFVDESKARSSKLFRFKEKFMSKEPLSSLWSHEAVTPFKANSRRRSSSSSSLGKRLEPLNWDNEHETSYVVSNDQYMPYTPPLPPPHTSTERIPNDEPRLSSHTANLSPPKPYTIASSPIPPQSSPGKAARKPPPCLRDDELDYTENTNIPFSAESFQLDVKEDGLMPTKVFQLGKQVKSLTVTADTDEIHKISSNELDPRYYAPTPSEAQRHGPLMRGANPRFEDISMDTNTEKTGYLGEGIWKIPRESSKFSPSVFERINDENQVEEIKPAVPPKIPNGISEREYYVLEKDSFLKDINGRRL